MNALDTVHLRRHRDVAGRSIDGEFILLTAAGRQIQLLNESATAVWEMIRDGIRVDELIGELQNRFDVDEAVLRKDVARVLTELDELGLIEDCESPAIRGVTEGLGCEAHASRGVTEDLGRESRAIHGAVGPFRALESILRVRPAPGANDADMAGLFDELAPVLKPLCQASIEIDLSDQANNAALVDFEIEYTAIPNTAIPNRAIQDALREDVAKRWTIKRNGTVVASLDTRSAIRESVLAEVNAACIAGLSESVGFHAGAVQFPRGVVLFPGISNAGKSTLVMQLLERGHGYLSDEVAAVHVDTRAVSMFAKSVCVDRGAQTLFPELCPRGQKRWETWHVNAEHIGLGHHGVPGQPVGIVFPTYEAGASLSMVDLPRLAALERLLENSFDFTRTGRKGAELLLALSDEVPCFELLHGGQREHVDVLEAHFGRFDG